MLAAAICWLFAIGFISGVWWPLVVLLVAGVFAAFWLKSSAAKLGRLLVPTLFAAALLVLRLTQGGPFAQQAGQPSMSFVPWAHWLRSAATSALTGVSQDSAALTLGLAIGDSSKASQQLLQDMKITGMTHLVAVSGANCAIVVGAVYLLLRRLSIRNRVTFSLASLVAYVLLVGAQPSVLRAAVMSAAVLLAQLTGRRSSAINLLAISVVALLVASPEMALSYSFALSVSATAGILLLAPELASRFTKRMPRAVALVLAATIGAQIMCLPILLQLQSGLSTYSVAANLLAEPLVAPITILSIAAVLLSFVAPFASVLFYIASLPASVIASMAHFFANLPLAMTPWFDGIMATVMGCVLTVALAVSIRAKSRLLRSFGVLIAAVSMLGSIATITNSIVKLNSWPQANWQVASCDVGQGDATVIRSEGQIALIDVGRSEPKIDSCLSRLGVSQIDLLVLTHYDFDHVGALAGAIKGRTVKRTLLTPFKDDRPEVWVIKALVNSTSCEQRLAETGLTGELGAVAWRVLSPSKTAEEAEDSNDGSITMLFKFSDFSVITLADLGEKGQMRLAESLRSWYDEFTSTHDLIMKVSHHGSADQYHELIEYLHPTIALISVGKNNGYGHPTQRTLSTLLRASSLICRTDQLGSIAISRAQGVFAVANTGAS